MTFPLGACFTCGLEGHWANTCPRPKPLPGPGPKSGQTRHWKVNCGKPGQPIILQWDTGRKTGKSPLSPSQNPPRRPLTGTTCWAWPWKIEGVRGYQVPFPTTNLEPWVSMAVAGKTVWFLLDTEASYSALRSFQGVTYTFPTPIPGVTHHTSAYWTFSLHTFGHHFLPLMSSYSHLPNPNNREGDPDKIPGIHSLSNTTKRKILTLTPARFGPLSSQFFLSPSDVNPIVWDTSTPSIARHRSPVLR